MTIYSYCPTKKIFGQSSVSALIREIEKPARVALIASSSALQAPGLLDELASINSQIHVRKIYHAAGEPDYLKVHAITEELREERITDLLCIGGGAIIDLSKAVAVCTHFTGNAEEKWHQLLSSAFDTPALPIFVVSSLPGTSSEANSGFVIKDARQYKRALSKLLCFPRVMAFDARFASTLPKEQISLSMFDALVHVLEQCIRPESACLINDGLCVTAISTILDLHRRLLDGNFGNEELLRFSRLSSFIIDGATLGRGVLLDFVTHELAVFLSAHFPLTHGATLACILPEYLDHPANTGKRLRFEQLMARALATVNEFHGAPLLSGFDLRRHIADAGIVCHGIHGDTPEKLNNEIENFLEERNGFWQQKEIAKTVVEDILRNAIAHLNA